MEPPSQQHLNDDRIHVVAIPYPAQGHIVSLMQLCEQLAFRGFVITFVNIEHNHARLLQSQADHARAHTCGPGDCTPHLNNIRLVEIPGGLPPELHGNQDHVVAAFRASEDLREPFEQLLERLKEDGTPASYVLSDVMMSWTQDSADNFGIPRIAFWTSSAAVYSAIWHTYLLILQGRPTFKAENALIDGSNAEIVSCIPGLPPMDLNDLPIIVRSDPADFIYQFLTRQLKPLVRASHIILNTFYKLEDQCLDALRTGNVPICTVGPLLPPAFMRRKCDLDSSTTRPSIFSVDEGCLEWLDRQKPRSVLYISFGSIIVMAADQLVELAAGLDSSQQSFLWAMRPNFVQGGVDEKLLAGFLDRTKHKGFLIFSWVPQLRVLAHPSIGGFLTHCGWNSVLESVALGVPMLCWPDVGERRTNGRLAVSVWKVGLEFNRSKDGSVGRKEVERVIRELMENMRGTEMRVRAAELREAAMESVQDGGSSQTTWDTLVEDMTRKAGSSGVSSCAHALPGDEGVFRASYRRERL